MKFAKVMFLRLSVSYSVYKGAVPGQVHLKKAGTTPPEQVHPLDRYTPWTGTPHQQVHPQAGTPPMQVHPSGRYTPQAGTPPRAVHAGRYGHPTGMHSCFSH